MTNNIKKELLLKAEDLLNYLSQLEVKDSINYSESEVNEILEKEQARAQINFDAAIKKFEETNYQRSA